MKDIYADTLRERARQSLPGWLTSRFGQASGAYEFYGLAAQRKSWREMNAQFALHGTLDHEQWHPPSLRLIDGASGQIYVPQMKGMEIYQSRGRTRKTLSSDFVGAVRVATDFLPPAMQTLVAERGTRLKIARLMTDIDPAYRTIRCRGQGTATVINCSGIFDTVHHFAAVTQGYVSRYTGKFVDDNCETTIETLLHEFGHDLEDMLFNTNDMSSWKYRCEPHQRDFFRARRADVLALNGKTFNNGQSLTYYLTEEQGGTQATEAAAASETFAQLFGEKYADMRVSLQRTFPRSADVLTEIMRQLEDFVSNDPGYSHIAVPDSMVARCP